MGNIHENFFIPGTLCAKFYKKRSPAFSKNLLKKNSGSTIQAKNLIFAYDSEEDFYFIVIDADDHRTFRTKQEPFEKRQANGKRVGPKADATTISGIASMRYRTPIYREICF